MRELLEILNGIEPDVDFRSADGIISNHLIESSDIASMVADIEDTFGVEFEEYQLTEKNFDSVDAIWNLIQELQD